MRLIVLLGLALLPLTVQAAEVRTVAVLPFDFHDDSLQGDIEGPQEEDLERVDLITRLAREKLDNMPEFEVVSNDPASALIAEHGDRYRYLHRCNGCEFEIARALDADLVMVGWAQKISNLILNVNGVIRETATHRDLAGGSVDMRSNTDEAWTRAALRLITDILPRSYAATLDKKP